MGGTPRRGGHDGGWGATVVGTETVEAETILLYKEDSVQGYLGGGGRRRGRVRGGGIKQKWKKGTMKKKEKEQVSDCHRWAYRAWLGG